MLAEPETVNESVMHCPVVLMVAESGCAKVKVKNSRLCFRKKREKKIKSTFKMQQFCGVESIPKLIDIARSSTDKKRTLASCGVGRTESAALPVRVV
jgi:hypothetical protein